MKSIALDAGHYNKTPGKRSPDNTYFEYEFNWDMCLKIKNHLERCGIKVYLTRERVDSGNDDDLGARVKVANDKKVDFFFSVHTNAAGNNGWYNTARGLSAHIYTGSKSGEAAANTILKSIFPYMTTNHGLQNRGVVQQNLYVTRATSMPAVLMESAFHTSKQDVALLVSQTFRRALAECEAKGICNYLGVTWVNHSDNFTYSAIGECNTSGTVVKKRANTSGEQLTILHSLCQVEIVSKSDNFYKILYGSDYGYIETKYIDITKGTPAIEGYNSTTSNTSTVTNNNTVISNAEKAWNFYKNKGLSDYAIAGILGNLDAESAIIPNNLQNTFNTKLGLSDQEYTAKVDDGSYANFKTDRAGYGLAQWTSSDRKENLLKYAKSVNKSISDIDMQLEFLWSELNGNYKNTVLEPMKKSTTVKEASTIFLQKFEIPATAFEQTTVNLRSEKSQNYYNKYAKPETTTDKVSDTVTLTYKTGFVNVESLNVRSSTLAVSNANILGQLSLNQMVVISEILEGVGWYKIKYNGGYGYVNSKYISNVTDVKQNKDEPTEKTISISELKKQGYTSIILS